MCRRKCSKTLRKIELQALSCSDIILARLGRKHVSALKSAYIHRLDWQTWSTLTNLATFSPEPNPTETTLEGWPNASLVWLRLDWPLDGGPPRITQLSGGAPSSQPVAKASSLVGSSPVAAFWPDRSRTHLEQLGAAGSGGDLINAHRQTIMKSNGDKQINNNNSSSNQCALVSPKAHVLFERAKSGHNSADLDLEPDLSEDAASQSSGYADESAGQKIWLTQIVGQLKQALCSLRMLEQAKQTANMQDWSEILTTNAAYPLMLHLDRALKFKTDLEDGQALLAEWPKLWPMLGQNRLVLYTCAANNLLEANKLLGFGNSSDDNNKELRDKLTSVRPVFRSILLQTNGRFLYGAPYWRRLNNKWPLISRFEPILRRSPCAKRAEINYCHLNSALTSANHLGRLPLNNQ